MRSPVYVLVGGASRRFGADKASHPIDGVPWAIDVGRRLAGGDRFTLVGRTPGSALFAGVRTIADDPSGRGPLAGVVAALADRAQTLGEGPLVLASCDLVRPQREWLTPLLTAMDAEADLPAAAYRVGDLWQPFPSALHTRLLVRARALAAEGAALQRLFDATTRAERWPAEGAGPPQANTKEALRALLAR